MALGYFGDTLYLHKYWGMTKNSDFENLRPHTAIISDPSIS